MKKKPRNERKPMADGDLPRGQQQEKKLKQESKDIAKSYQPTAEDLAAIDAVCAGRIKTPRVKVSEKGLSLDHPNPEQGASLRLSIIVREG